MIKEGDKVVTTGNLAVCLNISRPFLRKILQKMNQVGVLDSYKGKNGGFKMSLSADRIFLIDLINIFQGPIQLSGCYAKGHECPLVKDCPIRQELETLEQKLVTDLSKISLKMLIDKKADRQNQKT